jgi:hypothetical protein
VSVGPGREFDGILAPADQAMSYEVGWRCALETMIGIAALLVGAGIGWLCFAVGVYLLTRTGREGIRLARTEKERRQDLPPKKKLRS